MRTNDKDLIQEVKELYEKTGSGHRVWLALDGRMSRTQVFDVIRDLRPEPEPLREEDVFEAYERLGSVFKVARELKRDTSAIQEIIRRGVEQGVVVRSRRGRPPHRQVITHNREPADVEQEEEEALFGGSIYEKQIEDAERSGKDIDTYILTCAQNNAEIHQPLWENLLAYAGFLEAPILVGKSTYQQGRNRLTENRSAARIDPEDENNWDYRLRSFIQNDDVKLADDLTFFAEMNIIPTAKNPLTDLESYSGDGSGIFPHVKTAMESLPRMKGDDPRFNFTTGTVTQRLYIKQKQGQKAEHHHSYGALIVEVDRKSGDWWVRQLVAKTGTGSFCDLNYVIEDGQVSEGDGVEAATLGDLHYDRSDKDCLYATLGPLLGTSRSEQNDNLLDTLRPQHVFIHDGLDFNRRNHHDANNHWRNYCLWLSGRESVEGEVRNLGHFLTDLANRVSVYGGKVLVVDSNHDNALEKWLGRKAYDFRTDHPNRKFYARLHYHRDQLLEDGVKDDEIHLLTEAIRLLEEDDRARPPQYDNPIDLSNIRFLYRDESYVVLDIEQALHGDMGINGARGNKRSFAKLPKKCIIGHSHSPGIYHGVYIAGTSSMMDMGYNKGSTTWAHSHVITYRNGKRTILTLSPRTKRFWADRRS